jgi:hypothetical protein
VAIATTMPQLAITRVRQVEDQPHAQFHNPKGECISNSPQSYDVIVVTFRCA